MDNRKIMILGGYGSAGLPLARLLLANSDARVILAGRSPEKAGIAADTLDAGFGARRVSARRVDASDPDDLRRAFRNTGVEMIVVASSTAANARDVACAALEAGIDYYDIQFSGQKLAVLRSLAPDIERAGRCFITDGGFHPGLPAAMVRYAARHFDRLETANVGSVVKVDWAKLSLSDATIEEFVREFTDFSGEFFREGRWIRAGWRELLAPRRMDFGPVFCRCLTAPSANRVCASRPRRSSRCGSWPISSAWGCWSTFDSAGRRNSLPV